MLSRRFLLLKADLRMGESFIYSLVITDSKGVLLVTDTFVVHCSYERLRLYGISLCHLKL